MSHKTYKIYLTFTNALSSLSTVTVGLIDNSGYKISSLDNKNFELTIYSDANFDRARQIIND